MNEQATYCGCKCRECRDELHCQTGECNYCDHMTGPIGLIETS
jgi:hypothetical protein